MLILPLLTATALAAPQDIAKGWYLAESGRLEQAALLAVEALNENEDDLGAHRLYQWTLLEALQEGPALEQQYRRWVEQEPDTEVPRVALAGLLVLEHKTGGPWCEELGDLLEPMPEDTGLRYWALRYRYESLEHCTGETEAVEQALLDLAEVTPTALGLGLKIRLARGRVDAEVAEDLRTFYSYKPWNLAFPGNLWSDDIRGPALKQAREDALKAATDAVQSDHLAEIQAAWRIFRYARHDPGIVQAEMRRSELDPEWQYSGRVWVGDRLYLTGEADVSRLEVEIFEARHKASLEAAFAALQELEPKIPRTGPLRAMWLKELAFVQLRAGEDEKAFNLFKKAWQVDPNNATVANAFAYTAALRGEELELALVAMESVLANTPPYRPWDDYTGQGYEAWAVQASNRIAARLDTKAWILFQLGRVEEAAAVMQRALLHTSDPDPILYHHMGMVLLEMGWEDEALEYLGRGLALGPSDEASLDHKARRTAERLFHERRWTPGGFDAWLTTRLPHDRPACYLGGVIPEFPFWVDDKKRTVADFEGVRILVFWRHDSQAFVESIPYWEELANKYRKEPVHLIGISVDEQPEHIASFWEGYRFPPLLLGWAEPEVAEALDCVGIPTVFVVDEKGTIQGHLSGYIREDDNRIEQWVEALIWPEP